MKKSSWKQETARDLIALGSIPFYLLVTVRAIVGQYLPFVYHLVFAFLIFMVLHYFITSTEQYIGRALILVIFTSFFYQAPLFTIFAIIALLAIIWSAAYRKIATSSIILGIVLGAFSAGLSYVVTLLLLA